MATNPLRMGTTEHLARSSKATGARPLAKIGAGKRPVPLLGGAVGRAPAANAPADVALVDAAFAALASLRPAVSAPTPSVAPPNTLAVCEAVRNYQADRPGAIAAFQQVEDIREAQDGIVSPDSLTWEALFTWGELARDLEAVRDRKINPLNYIHAGGFDEAVFQAEAAARFKSSKADGGRFNAGSVPAMLDLLRRCARDPRIVDVRWVAYMLATAMWETSHGVSVLKPSGKGTMRENRWGAPTTEIGQGRINATDIKAYYLPVKVLRNADGTATVTEQDGDTFTVNALGAVTKKSKGATHGSNAFAAATAAYASAQGTELKYYGRGYCQLTWWDNYASTGAEIGLGLQLLFNPELALDPAIAYEVMAHGMVHGSGFANGRRLQMYFNGVLTNYVGARAMVNGSNEAQKIAAVAQVFEAALLAARR